MSLEHIFNQNKIQYCDFLKMDCEGAEFEILINTKKLVLKKIRLIAGELHEGLQKRYSTNDLIEHLRANNFQMVIQNGCFYAENNIHRKNI